MMVLRYNIVVFGDIDVFSHNISWCNLQQPCINHTLAFFLQSVEKFGFPLRAWIFLTLSGKTADFHLMTSRASLFQTQHAP
ncbi:hypothetical protein PFLUV_G00054150 [Perca fluviatilis]|uniref:Uncharacterized protein n=1 Tax=Perca fluviatilis TaxID=8168 RepID=A0A6A5EL69_PERFL|nr:hypothetical protein PFLUV_G00054150 [Perca fluviatilis]